MILPKPLSELIPAKRPARKPKRMTIAIGMLCDEGLIIAADTQLAMTDGTTREGIKVHQAIADTGVYVTANATEDGNAANTLIPDILTDLQNEDPKDFANVERIVRNSMSEWAERYRQGNPYIQIILGASINRPIQQNIRTGGGVRLYSCEPPNTMFAVDREDASGGYIGIGAGSSITDPVFRTLFSATGSANTGLHQIAYLMHRAKKDAATSCGGQTNAVLLKYEFGFPLWVEPRYMKIAEEESGNTFDFCLRMTTCSLLAQTDEAAETIWGAIKDYLTNQGKFFRSHRFLTQSGEDVGLPPYSQSQE
jgi:20S proteasome alpha/beta subunit